MRNTLFIIITCLLLLFFVVLFRPARLIVPSPDHVAPTAPNCGSANHGRGSHPNNNVTSTAPNGGAGINSLKEAAAEEQSVKTEWNIRNSTIEKKLGRNLTRQELADIASVESVMGTPLTTEQILLKPKETSWDDWLWVLVNFEGGKADNVPIEFFGRVVTNAGDPISDVDIAIEIHRNIESLTEVMKNNATREKVSLQISTDENGIFEITAEKGVSLHLLKLKKAGFQSVGKKNWIYSFRRGSGKLHKADKEKPVQFVMEMIKE